MLSRILFTITLCLTMLTAGFAQSESASSEKPITLRFTVWDGDEASKVLRKEIANFEKAHPKIKVKLEPVNYDRYFEKLLTQYAADVAPDVAMMDPGNFQRFSKRGAIFALEEFFDDVPGFDIKSYYPSIVKAHSYKGELFVLPRDIAPMAVVYYNKDMFDKAGIPYPDGNWTWDFKPHPELGDKDFLTLLKKFQRRTPEARSPSGATFQDGPSSSWTWWSLGKARDTSMTPKIRLSSTTTTLALLTVSSSMRT